MTNRLLICGLLLLYAHTLAFTQQSQLPPLLDPFELERGSVPNWTQGMIRFDVEVRDSSDRPVMGLTQPDFTLQDNGQPGKIITFQALDGEGAKTDRSIEVIMVIDELNINTSQDGAHHSLQLLALESEAEKFLRQRQGDLVEPVTIYRITREGLSRSAHSSMNGNAVADEIARQNEPLLIWKPSMIVKSSRLGSVNRNLALSVAALGSIAIEERHRPSRKLLFWFGPGWPIDGPGDNQFVHLFKEVSIRLREARITLWQATEGDLQNGHSKPARVGDFIHQEVANSAGAGNRDLSILALEAMAAQTGGGVLKADQNLGDLIAKRVRDAGRFYSLTFDPPCLNQVDQYRSLRVEVDRQGLTAYTRTFYLDEPVFYDQPIPETEFVTVEQLEQALKAGYSKPDIEMGRQLSAMQLTERLNSARAALLESGLKGKKSREAFVALADRSVFLAPPKPEILSDPPPDRSVQKDMLSRAVQYAQNSFPKLPDFMADRMTISYPEVQPKAGQTWKIAIGDQSLHLGEALKANVMFREGREVSTTEAIKGSSPKAGTLQTVGVFGPIVAVALMGATAPNSDITWSRWEQGAREPSAVFRYHAKPQDPLFTVGAESLSEDGNIVSFEMYTPFHGELEIDPQSGAILRLTMQADIQPRLPLDESDVMVEYGPVAIGGNTYICPLKSVSISRQRRIMNVHEWGLDFKVYAPFASLLNDTAFANYHLFHSTVRMLPGFSSVPKDN